ncbi:MAG: hypothetical protein PHU23_01200 [Dehalococcoidales bacterium]|nr:hypothetical protein [Dehalococcoidales bacterium]
MKSKKVKSSKTNKNIRNVEIPCIECGRTLKFHIEDDIVVLEGDGVIAVNFPGAVCHDCIDSVLDKVKDPHGLVCIKNLSPILAQELLLSFTFLLPLSEAVKFFSTLFPEISISPEAKIWADAPQR